MAKQFTLGKKERVKSRKLIEQLFNEGKSFFLFPFKIFYIIQSVSVSPLIVNDPRLQATDLRLPTSGSLRSAPDSSLRFGVGVGTRNFKRAPDRNRIKRLTREAYRLQKSELQEKIISHQFQCSLFFIYTGKELPDHLLVKEKTRLILDKLIKVVDENIAATS
ncbi:MAG: ribonuclease P protein component [Chitinophagaceae bacterium]